MNAHACPFCDHGNTAGSKFCNECGWPLRLKPCSACERLSDARAERCEFCEASFDDPSMLDEQLPRIMASLDAWLESQPRSDPRPMPAALDSDAWPAPRATPPAPTPTTPSVRATSPPPLPPPDRADYGPTTAPSPPQPVPTHRSRLLPTSALAAVVVAAAAWLLTDHLSRRAPDATTPAVSRALAAPSSVAAPSALAAPASLAPQASTAPAADARPDSTDATRAGLAAPRPSPLAPSESACPPAHAALGLCAGGASRP